jgi:prophage regulatory protein
MQFTMMRTLAVAEARGVSRSQLYIDVEAGLVTPPIKRSTNINVWPSTEIEAINRLEASGASQDELRALVRQLIAQRQQGRIAPPMSTAAA